MKAQRILIGISMFAALLTLVPTNGGRTLQVPSVQAQGGPSNNRATATNSATFNNKRGLTLSVSGNSGSTFAFGDIDFTADTSIAGSAVVTTNDSAGYTLTVTGPKDFVSGANKISDARLKVAASGGIGSGSNVTLAGDGTTAQTIKTTSAASTGGDTSVLTLTLRVLSTDPVADTFAGNLVFTATGN